MNLTKKILNHDIEKDLQETGEIILPSFAN